MLQQLFRFPGLRMGLEASDGRRHDAAHLMLTVSNGRYFGGGFPIAPEASLDDGRLHACRIGDASPLARLKLFNMAADLMKQGKFAEAQPPRSRPGR